MAERLLTTADAARELGIWRNSISRWCQCGMLPGAFRDYTDARNGDYIWRIPESAVAAMRESPLVKARALRRCEVCGIVLERSGDELHPNDRPDAGRCWFCRGER